MDFDSVREQVYTTFKNEFTAAHPTVVIAYSNQDYQQPVNAPWVHVSVIPGHSRKAEIGGDNFFHFGVINVTTMVPVGSGTKASNDMAQTIFEMFADRNWSLPGGGYLTTYCVERKERGNINGWYTVNVMCDFRHQAQRTS